MKNIFILFIIFSSITAFAKNNECDEVAYECIEQINKRNGEDVCTDERRVFKSILNAHMASEADKQYWSLKSLVKQLITYKTYWQSSIYSGSNLVILDAETCKELALLTITSD